MKFKKFLSNLHSSVVSRFADSSFVEKYLIAKTKHDNEWYDCIYCTIIRCAVLFGLAGFWLGVIFTMVLQ